jgi:hypothetical protein
MKTRKKPMKGRKPKQDSRADEIRERLMEWKEKPESERPSLRALAIELRTSHQLLSHYLEGLDKWCWKELLRRSREIQARAETEHRLPTPSEEQQICYYGRTAVDMMAMGAINGVVKQWERDAKANRLTTKQIRVLTGLASKGHEMARKFLENLSGA